MMFKHHIGDVLKPISDLFQTNDNYHSYSTRTSKALLTSIGKSEAICQTFTYIGSLVWNYISSKIPTEVTYICFKNIAKSYIQANRNLSCNSLLFLSFFLCFAYFFRGWCDL